MKRSLGIAASLVLALLLVREMSRQNPIVGGPCSEFMFTDSGWVMEMHVIVPATFDVWQLGSTLDTVGFRPGITGVDFMCITPESLQQPLVYNRVSDLILLFGPETPFQAAVLSYGEAPEAAIAAPRPGQSICYKDGGDFYYLDNTPTLGAPNDESGATGEVRGTVTDTLGVPIAGVVVRYHDWMGYSVVTDTGGHYSFTDLASRQYINFSHPDFVWTYRIQQVWPESTVELSVMMSRLESVGDDDRRPNATTLSFNYPNPFNPSTTFDLHLQHAGFVSVRVYTVGGDEVARLVEANLNPGIHRLRWNAEGLSSGVYLCRLRAANQTVTRKVLLVR